MEHSFTKIREAAGLALLIGQWCVHPGGALAQATSGGQPDAADYGDAPDDDPACPSGEIASYPTQWNTSNAMGGRTAPYHVPLGDPNADYMIGGPPTYEGDAIEAISCDWVTGPPCDFDDGAIELFFPDIPAGIMATGDPDCGMRINATWGPCVPGPEPAVWIFDVSRGPFSNQSGYVNVVVDFNADGVYGDTPGEWVLQDAVVQPAAWQTQVFVTDPFPVTIIPTGDVTWAVAPFWTRVMLSDEPLTLTLPDGVTWDGSGQIDGYQGGETEDWVPLGDPGDGQEFPPPWDSWIEADGHVTFTLDPRDRSCENSRTFDLSSQSEPTVITREVRQAEYQTGGRVLTEILALELTSTDVPITVRLRRDHMTLGTLFEVQADESGDLRSARSYFDAFIEIEFDGKFRLDTGDTPIRLDAGVISAFPPAGQTYAWLEEQPPLPLYFAGTNELAGWICSASLTALNVFDCSQPAPLLDFSVVTGRVLEGDLSSLEAAGDNDVLRLRSGFGRTLTDLHHMEMIVSAKSAVARPLSMDLAITSSISEQAGRAHIRLRNALTGKFDEIGAYAIGKTDETVEFNHLPAWNYVNEAGEIDLSIKHIVFVPYLAFTFESYIDYVGIRTN